MPFAAAKYHQQDIHPAIILALLAAGANVSLLIPVVPYRPNGTSLPLELATQTRDVDVVKLLVDASALIPLRILGKSRLINFNSYWMTKSS
jgi:hypothetical protein